MTDKKTEKNDDKALGILRRYHREVPVILPDAELQAYGQNLAFRKKARDVLVEKAKQVQAHYKGLIAEESTEIDRLAYAINEKKELRSVDVYDQLVGSQVHVVRVDTSEVIDQKPAGFADREQDLFPEPQEPEVPSDPSDPASDGNDFQPPPASKSKKGKGGKKPRKAKAN